MTDAPVLLTWGTRAWDGAGSRDASARGAGTVHRVGVTGHQESHTFGHLKLHTLGHLEDPQWVGPPWRERSDQNGGPTHCSAILPHPGSGDYDPARAVTSMGPINARVWIRDQVVPHALPLISSPPARLASQFVCVREPSGTEGCVMLRTGRWCQASVSLIQRTRPAVRISRWMMGPSPHPISAGGEAALFAALLCSDESDTGGGKHSMHDQPTVEMARRLQGHRDHIETSSPGLSHCGSGPRAGSGATETGTGSAIGSDAAPLGGWGGPWC